LKTSYRRRHLAASTSVARSSQRSPVPASMTRVLCMAASLALIICLRTLSSCSTYNTTTCASSPLTHDPLRRCNTGKGPASSAFEPSSLVPRATPPPAPPRPFLPGHPGGAVPGPGESIVCLRTLSRCSRYNSTSCTSSPISPRPFGRCDTAVSTICLLTLSRSARYNTTTCASSCFAHHPLRRCNTGKERHRPPLKRSHIVPRTTPPPAPPRPPRQAIRMCATAKEGVRSLPTKTLHLVQHHHLRRTALPHTPPCDKKGTAKNRTQALAEGRG
jgi:hypothetical protein